MNSNVDEYINEASKWQEEIKQLRMLCLDCGLTEEIKWGTPCYSFQGSNIAIIQPLKKSCALMFFKGVLLKYPEDVLEKPGKNSRIARRIPFTSVEEIVAMDTILKSYIQVAIEAEKAGLEVDVEEEPEPIPKELQAKFDEIPDLKASFDDLTPGRQRGYLLYFSDAKQSQTRKRRVEKYIPKILDGKGLQE